MFIRFRSTLPFLLLSCFACRLPALSLVDGWEATGHGGVSVQLRTEGDTLRLDYQRNAPGFIMLKRIQTLELPDRYAIRFEARGLAERSDLELRLPDPMANNVWSWKHFGFQWPTAWEQVHIPGRAIEFAWGPSPLPLKQMGAVELFITPSGGGHGTLELRNPVLESLPPLDGHTPPRVESHDSAPGFPPEALLKTLPGKGWRSRTGIEHPTLTFDFGGWQAIAGMVPVWCAQMAPAAYRLEVSSDRKDWRLLRAVEAPGEGRNLVHLPDTDARFLRLIMETRPGAAATCLDALQFIPARHSAPNDFFKAMARSAHPGDYPAYWLGNQSYYTVVGAPGNEQEGLLNQQGLLESGRGQFSIEPFLFTRNRLLTWHDGISEQSLEQGFLPVPSVHWRHLELELTTTAFATSGSPSTLYARYRLFNHSPARQQARLLLALRPFQVNPPWQSLNMSGGFAELRSIRQRDDSVVEINGAHALIPLTPPGGFGALRLEQGSLMDTLRTGSLPATKEARDDSGLTSGVLSYEMDLAPHATRDVYIALPFGSTIENALKPLSQVQGPNQQAGEEAFRQAVSDWSRLLQGPRLNGPAAAEPLFDTLRSNLAYILIHRDGAAFQPGSRAYARSWIRDSALMSSALLGWGHAEEVRAFLRWYAGFQQSDGTIPCCLDPRGAEVVPEHDSHGELIHILAEYYRYTHDIELVRELWPVLLRTVDAIEHLRQQRMTEDYRTGDKAAFYGLMPESISHEGYSGHPVHAFWDDFWTLRGLKDATMLAEALGLSDEATRIARLRDGLSESLKAAIARTIRDRRLNYVPSSVELGDFDVNSTAIAINLGLDGELLPAAPLKRTFDDYRNHFEKRRQGRLVWEAYTPYEIRSVEALVRLGRRKQALELLDFLMAGRRPQGWNQWTEIVWRNPLAPKFIGDSPHAWIGAEFVQAVRSLYAYEREYDQSLILAAGISESWLKGKQTIGVEGLPTGYGPLDYSMQRRDARTIRLTLEGGLKTPPGGIVIKVPSSRPLRRLMVNGKSRPIRPGHDPVIHEVPAEVLLQY